MSDTTWKFECQSCGALYQDRSEWCLRCGSFGLVWPRYWSRQSEAIPSVPFRSAQSLYRTAGKWADDLPDFFSTAIGKLPADGGYLVILSGAPGAGKTSAIFKWADAWARTRGRVSFVALEEGSDGAIGQHLRRLEVCAPELMIGSVASVEELRDAAASSAALFLDSLSVSLCTGFDLSRIAQETATPIIATVHTRKDGEPGGSNEIIHAADLALHLTGVGKVERRKSRYCPAGEEVSFAQ